MQEIDRLRLAKELIHVRLPVNPSDAFLPFYLAEGCRIAFQCNLFSLAATHDERQYPKPTTAKARNYRRFLLRAVLHPLDGVPCNTHLRWIR